MTHLSSNHPDLEIRQRSNELLKAAGYTTEDADNSRPAIDGSGASFEKFKNFILSLLILLFFIAFLTEIVPALNSVKSIGQSEIDKRVAQVDEMIPEIIRDLKVRQESTESKGLYPTLVWEGKDATVLTTVGTVHSSKRFKGKKWTTIAQTKNGRYFTVTHVLTFGCPGSNWMENCFSQKDFSALTVDEAKRMIHKMGDAALFEKTFGEKMPPVEIKA